MTAFVIQLFVIWCAIQYDEDRDDRLLVILFTPIEKQGIQLNMSSIRFRDVSSPIWIICVAHRNANDTSTPEVSGFSSLSVSEIQETRVNHTSFYHTQLTISLHLYLQDSWSRLTTILRIVIRVTILFGMTWSSRRTDNVSDSASNHRTCASFMNNSTTRIP